MPSKPLRVPAATVAALLLAAVPLAGPAAANGTAAADRVPTEPGPGGHPAARTTGLEAVVDREVARMLREDRVPGAAVTVVSGGRAVLSKGYGVADSRTRTPVDPERTGFFLGSLAKLFTAQAAARLVAQGRIDPHADVNGALRDMAVPDTYPGRPVTLDHLLTHTGGFDSDLVGRNAADPADVEPLLESLTTHRPPRVRPPGETAAYDNYGFALAGQLVADVSGLSFPEYVRRHILVPLGMRHTSLHRQPPHAERLARGHRPTGGHGQTGVRGQYGAWTPAGPGVTATAADLGRWMNDQLTGDAPANRLMQRTRHRQDPRMPGLGWGFEEWRRGGLSGWFKDGDLPGFHSNLLLLPAQRLGVFVIANGDGREGRAGYDGRRLTDRVVAAAAPQPRVPDACPVGTGDPARPGGPADPGGTYRPARVSRSGLMAVEGLVGTVTVDRDGPHGLRTSGLSPDPSRTEQRWTAVRGGCYRERDVPADGAAFLAFADDGTLVSSAVPNTAYEKLRWHQQPLLHMALIGFGLTVLLGAGAGFPALAAVRARRGQPRHPRPARAARAGAAVSGLLAGTFAVLLGRVVADGNRMRELVPLGSPLLTGVTTVGAALTAAVPLLLGAAAAGWVRVWWGVTGRVLYTLTAVAALVLAAMLLHYHLVAGPLGRLPG
ncbi:serine hydrolase domain-containing protein [Streptomyces sp. NPDC054784]